MEAILNSINKFLKVRNLFIENLYTTVGNGWIQFKRSLT